MRGHPNRSEANIAPRHISAFRRRTPYIMNPLLELLASLAAAGLITEETCADLTARIEAVAPAGEDDVTWESTDDDAEVAARENAAVALFANFDDDLRTDLSAALGEAAHADDIDIDLLAPTVGTIGDLRIVDRVGDEIAQARADERDALLAQIADAEPEGDDDDPENGDPTDPDAPTGEDDPADAEPDLEPVLASGAITRPRAGQIGRRTPERREPVATDGHSNAVYQLMTDVDGRRMGEALSARDFAESVMDRIDAMSGNLATGTDFVKLGRSVVEYPEAQRLGANPVENADRIRERITEMRLDARSAGDPAAAVTHVREVMASGGICAPPTPLYDYARVGDAGRPVRDFLASVQATRGGVTWRTPPTLADMGAVNTDNSGVTIWTADNDEDPSDPSTKAVFTVDCPELEDAAIYGLAARLKHGNFMGMYDRETVDQWVFLQEVVQARIAETALLNTIAANSKWVIENSDDLGFARDWLNAVDRYVTAERYRQRMGETEVVDMLAPSWCHAAVRGDRVKEIPGAAQDGFSMTNAQIDAWFTSRGVRVGWFRDSQAFADQGGGTGSAPGQLVPFPTHARSFIFDTGHHVLLDGGRFDIGVERSPTLNGTNDVQTMSETAENIASRGVFSTQLDVAVCVSGQTAATVSTDCDS